MNAAGTAVLVADSSIRYSCLRSAAGSPRPRPGCIVALWAAAWTPFATADQLELIEVTGTRIVRPDFATPSPIVSLSSESFRTTSAISVERALERLPQFVPTAGATSNSPENDGLSNLSLRGIGPRRTLVLLDGRRLVPADGSGTPDVNVLPPALIESVEVLTGGASAVYGSDALAGVVNFKLRDEYDGIAIDGKWSQTAAGDAQEYQLGVTAGTGFAGGRGSFVGYVGYAQRDLLLQSEREFSRLPLTYYADVDYGFGPGRAFLGAGGLTDYGIYPFVPPSATSPPTYEAIFAGYGYPPGSVPFVPGVSINDDGTAFMSGDGTANSVANFRGETEPGMSSDRSVGVNDAPWTALQLPLERASAFARVRYDISDATRVAAQVLYADYETTRRLGPVPGQVMLSPISNPYIPDDLAALVATRLNPLVPFRVLRRMPELGPRYARNERDLLQGTIELAGQLAGDWRYDAYLQTGRNQRLEHQTGNLLKSRFEELTFAPDGGQSICGLMNPFGRGEVSAACAEYMATDAQNETTVDQALAEASIAGTLFNLPAGELTVVLGVLHKEDEFRFEADPASSRYLPEIPGVIEARPDLTGFPVGPDSHGRVRNTDLYVEALVPLWRDAAAGRELMLGLGYRYSDYSQTGGVDSYKGELSYRPLASLRLRGSYQHAVRAPSVEELYSPQLSSQFGLLAPDPCNFDSLQRSGPDAAQVEALCVAQGVPSVLLPSYFYSLRRVGGITGGNPQLDAEVADTLTLGFVLTSPFDHPAASGLRLSVDGYWIEIDDAIARREVDEAVRRCFDPAINPDYDPANGNCSFFTRETSTGIIVASLLDRNLGRLETSGVDVQLEWSIDTRLGTFGINEYLTYVDTWRTQDTNSAPTEYAGTIGGAELGGALPKLRSLLEARFERQSFSAHARWQHLDEARDAIVRDFLVPSRDYFGIGATWQFTRPALAGLTVGGGIENLTDEQPPIFPTWQQANTDPSQYDVLGRRYYLDMRFSF